MSVRTSRGFRIRAGLTVIMALVLLALAGCAPRRHPEDAALPSSSAISSEREDGVTQESPALPANPESPEYIDQLVQETISRFAKPGMSQYEQAKAAFDYILDNTTLDDPVGLELWRVRGRGETASFDQNRSLSALAFGVGMCEDYAAALTMLLRGMGIEAMYVPGLTYAADGSGLVDHSWTVAKIDGSWYHLDSQLEQNVSRRGRVTYRFFMKGDSTLIGSHRWGRNLIEAGLLTPEQNEALAQNYSPPACAQDWPTPPPRDWAAPPHPDRAALLEGAAREVAAYETQNGALPPMELDIVPPVFGLEGYPVGS